MENYLAISEKIILSLTTIPSRLRSSDPLGLISVIYSLINQKHYNYEIHFNIPEVHKATGENYLIPNWLHALDGVTWQDKSTLRIFRTEDYGPITKLFPTLERAKSPEQLIIVLDDDLVYESRLIEEHLKLRSKNDDVAWAFSGQRMLDRFGRRVKEGLCDVRDGCSVCGWDECRVCGRGLMVNAPPYNVRVSRIEHYKSVSYRRSFFEEDFNLEFLKQTWNDDELISNYMDKKNIEKWIAYSSYVPKAKDQEQWMQFGYGGVTTFPVIRHAVHNFTEREGCDLFRA